MSRLFSVSCLTAALTFSALAAPMAFAQPVHVAAAKVAAPHKAANSCFTEDLVPNDDSSMLTICGVKVLSTIISAQ